MDAHVKFLLTMLAEVAEDPHCRRAMINRALRRAERESEGAPCDGWTALKAQVRAAARLRSTELAADTMAETAKRLEAEQSCPLAVAEFEFLSAALTYAHDPVHDFPRIPVKRQRSQGKRRRT